MKALLAKKSLGQNFLKDKSVLRKIVECSNVSEKDTVLEVGPGKGALTEYILQTGATVIAVEKDHRMIPVLQERFATEIASEQLVLLQQDALEFDYEYFQKKPFKIIANIPYYITGQFIRRSLETDSPDTQPELITLMIQKEVARRILARDKKESILSISVKAYGTPHYIQTVPSSAFSPKPKIDSAVIMIDDISKEMFLDAGVSEKKFFNIIKTGFSNKRKQLQKNLKPIVESEILKTVLTEQQLGQQIRAEDISITQWVNIIKKIIL